MQIIDAIKRAGVVGAGGAGFPAHVKLSAHAEYVIANGAECEPLLRADRALMCNYAEQVVKGLEAAMSAVGAKNGIIATKTHYDEAVDALMKAVRGNNNIKLHLMKSYYPAGDEKSLIYETTGRIVPNGMLPADVGCVVCNVATLFNISEAIQGIPVTHKYLTVGGDVKNPITLRAPVGTPVRVPLELAGFKHPENSYALFVGGPCMGRIEKDWDTPVTKTTGGLLLLPRNHQLVAKREMPLSRQLKLAQAVCCQCSQCTQLCPRNALGLNVQPHKAMRAVANADASLIGDANSILGCCSCGLCTDYACNMGLNPSAVMAKLKDELAKAGERPKPEKNIQADSDIKLKRAPVTRLIARMGISTWDVDAPLSELKLQPDYVRIPLIMHIGKPSTPVVYKGDNVKTGELIAEIPDKSLGAAIHASIDGMVTKVTDSFIEITGKGA